MTSEAFFLLLRPRTEASALSSLLIYIRRSDTVHLTRGTQRGILLSMQSVMGQQFSRAGFPSVPRSTFDLSKGHKSTFEAGYLVPFYCEEVLPGDHFKIDSNVLVKLLSPTKFPIMDNVHLDIIFFYGSYRIVFDNWVKLMGEQVNPSDSIDFLVPQVLPETSGNTYEQGTIYDYFRIPTKKAFTSNYPISIPFRLYNKFWNEWVRDENLQNSLSVPTDDGPDDYIDYTLQRRGKRPDYFTSCLPSPQKGDAVELSLGDGTQFPVIGDGFAMGFTDGTAAVTEFGLKYNSGLDLDDNYVGAAVGTNPGGSGTTPGTGEVLGLSEDPDLSHVFADGSNIGVVEINALREAFALQQFFEIDARAGTRYPELILAHFGVMVPDFRVQRTELLGMTSTLVNVSETHQSTVASTPGIEDTLGHQAGVVRAFAKCKIRKSFVEHGFVIGLLNVRADLNYQQGLERFWSRRERDEFYFPVLAHLGEQAVLNKEIYFDEADTPDGVFGYQERWAEYRYGQSGISGLFRSNATGSIDVFHLAQDFGAQPALNPTFIQDTPPMTRVVAVTNEDTFIFDSYNRVLATRHMPRYSIPGLNRL